jgi:biotin carboxylase
MPKVLVLGNYKQTLIVLRSLARSGFAVVVGKYQESSFTAHSRYVSEVWDHPPFESTAEFIDALVGFLSHRRDISFVFPVGEMPLDVIARNFERVAPAATLLMPHPRTALTCLDKQRVYEITSELSIPLPPMRRVQSHAELIAGAHELGFPCIVKPNDSQNFFFGEKAIICRNIADIEKKLSEWPVGNQFLILQQYVEGHRINCQFAAQRGRMTAYFEQKVLRTDRFDGTGYGVESLSVLPTGELMAHCETLLAGLEYSGVGCIQFLCDRRSKRFYFLEINPRLDATCALPYYCGMDFPKMAVDIALDQREVPPDGRVNSKYPAGRRASWLLGDVQGFARSIQSRSINLLEAARWTAGILNGFASADFHMTFSWRDPVPTLFLYMHPLWSRLEAFLRQEVHQYTRCP